MTKPGKAAARRPTRAGVSIESRRLADASTSFYARFTDTRGRRVVVVPPSGGQSWPDWGRSFAAACTEQTEAERFSYRSSSGGERMLFADPVAQHDLPTPSDAAPNTRENIASHLGDHTGVSTRKGRYAVRSQLLSVFGHLPIGAIGPNEVQRCISQMLVDVNWHATTRLSRGRAQGGPPVSGDAAGLSRRIMAIAADLDWDLTLILAGPGPAGSSGRTPANGSPQSSDQPAGSELRS